MSIATLQVEEGSNAAPNQQRQRVAALANSFLGKNSANKTLSFEKESYDVEVIELSPPQPEPQLRNHISANSTVLQLHHSISTFTAQLRFSSLSASESLKALAQTLHVSLQELGIDPWKYADLVTQIDVAVHLHIHRDRDWAKDVLTTGLSFSRAAALALKNEQAVTGNSNKCISMEPGLHSASKKRMQDFVDFFDVIVEIGSQSCYRARKLIRVLQGGWFTQGSIKDLAARVCVEDRWWKRFSRTGK